MSVHAEDVGVPRGFVERVAERHGQQYREQVQRAVVAIVVRVQVPCCFIESVAKGQYGPGTCLAPL